MAAVNPQLSNLNFWKTFDLVKFQKDLDQVALEIANRQDESDISRQKLVEQSREFKKNTPEDVKKYVGPLFKNFQQEIDSLSKRSKSGEAAFLSVYKQIIDFVDPSPLVDQCEKLQKSSQKVRDLELENKLLRDTLDDCKNDLGLVRQSEDMVKKLESKIKETDRNINALTEAAVAKIRAEMMASYAEKEALSNVEKEQLLATIEHLRGEIIMFRSSFDSVNAELLELRIKYDEHLTAKNSEVDMLAGDIDKLQTRAQSAEHECERLRKEMDHLRDPNSNQAIMGHDSSSVIKGLEKEAETRDKEARHLMEEVGRMKQNYGILEQVTATKIAYLEEQLSQKSSTYDELHQRLSTMADYQANKRELSILKSMEFSESSGEGNSLETPSIGEKEKALEILVMEKNKTLKSENSTMKVQKMQMNDRETERAVDEGIAWPAIPVRAAVCAMAGQGGSDSPTTLNQIASYYQELFSKWERSSNGPPGPDQYETVAKTHHQTPPVLAPTPTNRPAKSLTPGPTSPPLAATADCDNHAADTMGAGRNCPNDTTALTFQGSVLAVTPPAPSAAHRPQYVPQRSMYHEMAGDKYHFCDAAPSAPTHSTPDPIRSSSPGEVASAPPHPEPKPNEAPEKGESGDCSHHCDNTKHSAPSIANLPSDPRRPPSSDQSNTSSQSTTATTNTQPRLPLTDDIAKTVREALCFHQIGQRVFAKYILGLSQGTVSELLSKPKPWERLSGKGRESYRKMYAWVSDQSAILALKSLAPKRAKDMPQGSSSSSLLKREDKQTKEKIVDILYKAQKAMMHKESPHVNGETSCLGLGLTPPPPHGPKPTGAIDETGFGVEEPDHNRGLADYASALSDVVLKEETTPHESPPPYPNIYATSPSQKSMISNGLTDVVSQGATPGATKFQSTTHTTRSPPTKELVALPKASGDSSETLRDGPVPVAEEALKGKRGLPLLTHCPKQQRQPDQQQTLSTPGASTTDNINLATAFMYKMISALRNQQDVYDPAQDPTLGACGNGTAASSPYAKLLPDDLYQLLLLRNNDPSGDYDWPDSRPRKAGRLSIEGSDSGGECDKYPTKPAGVGAHVPKPRCAKTSGATTDPSPKSDPDEDGYNDDDPSDLVKYRPGYDGFGYRSGARDHAYNYAANPYPYEAATNYLYPGFGSGSAPNVACQGSACVDAADCLPFPPHLADFYRTQWEKFYNQGHQTPRQNASYLRNGEEERETPPPATTPFANGQFLGKYPNNCSQYDGSVAMWANLLVGHQMDQLPAQGPLNLTTKKKDVSSPYDQKKEEETPRSRTLSSCSTSESTASSVCSPLGKIHSITMSLCPSPLTTTNTHSITNAWHHSSRPPSPKQLGIEPGGQQPQAPLSSQAHTNPTPGSSRSTKNTLPPVPQELFAARSNLNTEDIVRRVKEHLAKYSISQRAFGEMVLGLSQGSVSDLLARPKPWSLLTQKGREPFIRMQIFLDEGKFTLPLSTSSHKKSSPGAAHHPNPNPPCNNNYSNKETDHGTKDRITLDKVKSPKIAGKAGSRDTSDPGPVTHRSDRQLPDASPLCDADFKGEFNIPTKPARTPFSVAPGDHCQATPLSPTVKLPTTPPNFSPSNDLPPERFDIKRDPYRYDLSSYIPGAALYSEDDKFGDLHHTVGQVVGSTTSGGNSFAEPFTSLLQPGPSFPPNPATFPNTAVVSSASDEDRSRADDISLASHNSVHKPHSTTGEESCFKQTNAHTPSHCGPSPIFPSPAHLMEITAVSGNLDTLQLTSRIKEILINYNIGQKVFGEAVLGLSQGSVSELLSKPKPWHMLSLKGREPFIRMHFWLNDSDNIERLKSLKQKKKSHINNPSIVTVTTNGLGSKKRQRSQLANLEEDLKEADTGKYPTALPNNNLPSSPFKPFTPKYNNAVSGEAQKLALDCWSTNKLYSDLLSKSVMGDASNFASTLNSLRQGYTNGPSSFDSGYDFFDEEDPASEHKDIPSPTHGSTSAPKNSPIASPKRSDLKWSGFSAGSPKRWYTHPPSQHLTNGRSQGFKKFHKWGGDRGPSFQRSTFSPAQKSMLKQVYQRDSYPSTETVSALATEFNVPARSIINWFHNHRMRLKTQYLPSLNYNDNLNGSSPQSPYNDDPENDSGQSTVTSQALGDAPKIDGNGYGFSVLDNIEPPPIVSTAESTQPIGSAEAISNADQITPAPIAQTGNLTGRRVNKRKANVPTKVEHHKTAKLLPNPNIPLYHRETEAPPLTPPERMTSDENGLWDEGLDRCINEYRHHTPSTSPSDELSRICTQNTTLLNGSPYMMTTLMPN